MIAHVNGVVSEKVYGAIIVDVSGLGYEVQVASGDYENAKLNEPIKLYTYHHVREAQNDLFGFSSLAAKRLFELLISVQGIGPKAALAILSIGNVEQVRSAVASEDISYIQQASGVGKRSAERVVVDLRDKVGLPSHTDEGVGTSSGSLATKDDALDALMALGFTLNDASQALKNISPTLPTEERIRIALREH